MPPPPSRRGAKPVEPQHVPFPGFAAAYNSGWPVKSRTTVATIDGAALSKALHIDNRNEAIKAAVDLYVTPLIAAAARIEDPPTFWFVVIPEEVYELGRPLSKVPAPERIQGSVRITKDQAIRLEDEHTLFGIDEAEAEVYNMPRISAASSRRVCSTTRSSRRSCARRRWRPAISSRATASQSACSKTPATVAWKLSTGAYYKDGGRPWQLADVRQGVCYVGLAYKRRDSTADDRFAVCAAQMFLSSGEGVVFGARSARGIAPTPNSSTSTGRRRAIS